MNALHQFGIEVFFVAHAPRENMTLEEITASKDVRWAGLYPEFVLDQYKVIPCPEMGIYIETMESAKGIPVIAIGRGEPVAVYREQGVLKLALISFPSAKNPNNTKSMRDWSKTLRGWLEKGEVF